MVKRAAFTIVAALMFAGWGNHAIAAAVEVPCGEPKTVLQGVKQNHAEVPAFTGDLANGSPFTITISPSGTWTFLVGVNGMLCIGSSGDHWQTTAAEPVKPSSGRLPDAPALLEHGLLLIRQ